MEQQPSCAPEQPGLPGETAAGLRVVGWKEYVDFPAWGVERVRVKIDTGARTSALDVLSYVLHESAAGELVAELHLALHRKHPQRQTRVQVPVLGTVLVRNSNGMRERRPVIETTVRLGPVCKRVRLTVTNRAGMCFPMILGRSALAGDFVVDVSREYLWRRKVQGPKSKVHSPKSGG